MKLYNKMMLYSLRPTEVSLNSSSSLAVSYNYTLHLCCQPSNVYNENDTQNFTTTYSLTPWCRVLLEKLPGLQLVKKFPAFYGTRRFITALTRLRHPSLSWASPVQSIYPHPTSWRSILILSTHLRLGQFHHKRSTKLLKRPEVTVKRKCTYSCGPMRRSYPP